MIINIEYATWASFVLPGWPCAGITMVKLQHALCYISSSVFMRGSLTAATSCLEGDSASFSNQSWYKAAFLEVCVGRHGG